MTGTGEDSAGTQEDPTETVDAAAPPVLVSRQNDVLHLTLNRPDRANALSPDLVEALLAQFGQAAPQGSLRPDGTSPRLCVIRGSGKRFCAGFDLDGLDEMSDGDLLWRFVRIEQLLQTVYHAPFPVLALAHRHAIGAGADLFAAATKRVAAPGTRFRFPGLNFGLTLGTRRLTGLIGADSARDVLIDARTFDAEEGTRLGIVQQLAEPTDWPELITEESTRAATLPPAATAAMLALSRNDTRAIDLAALVDSAATPGLVDRVIQFRERSTTTRKS